VLGASSLDRPMIDLVYTASKRVVVELAAHNLAIRRAWESSLPELLRRFRLIARTSLDLDPDWTKAGQNLTYRSPTARVVPWLQGNREMYVLERLPDPDR
jgi:hypothetical protein